MGATELLLLTASILGADDVTMLQFSADWCKHCNAMAPKVDQLERDGFPIVRINADTHKELIEKHRVRALPTFILMRDGRELDRAEGEVAVDRLTKMFQSGGYRSGATVRGQSPEPRQAADRTEPPRKGILSKALEQLTAPAATTAPPSAAATPSSTYAAPRPGQPAQGTLENKGPRDVFNVSTSRDADFAAAGRTTASSRGESSRGAEDKAMAASVKLRIEDAEGYSFGSGTIVDTHGSDALVLTCGHIFRDSKGKGVISVQITSATGEVKTVDGQLLAWEPDYHDIGLVAIRPGVEVTKAVVASSVTFRPHDSVFSIGCDRGADPSLRRGRISALNRFQGAPNIEVTGKPTLGRSGGGLFDRSGRLIGVCKLANPTDDEGIYASLESIHHHLNKTGLKHVYQETQPTKQLVAAAAEPPAPTPRTLDVRPASLPSNAPPAPATDVSSVRQVSAAIARGVADSDSEVIVIVRSKTNPRAKSQVMVVDDATDELLEAIHRAVNRHRNPAATAEAVQTNDRVRR